jgi:hypothetical protein
MSESRTFVVIRRKPREKGQPASSSPSPSPDTDAFAKIYMGFGLCGAIFPPVWIMASVIQGCVVGGLGVI